LLADISPDLWPLNSADLNPVEYKICGTMQQLVFQTKVSYVEDLKRRVIDMWADVIDDAINYIVAHSSLMGAF